MIPTTGDEHATMIDSEAGVGKGTELAEVDDY